MSSETRKATRVVILWSEGDDRSLARMAGDLAGVLRASAAPAPLIPITFDVAERMGTLSLARSLVGALGGARTEAAMVASLLAPELERELSAGGAVGAVIALDTTAAIIADRWAQKGLLSAPVVGVVGRLTLEPSWRRCVDRLFVLDDQQLAQAKASGFEEADVAAIGALAGPRVAAAAKQDRAALRRRYGLEEDASVVLFAASGLSELTTVLFQTTLLSQPTTLLFDVEGDDDSAALLRRRAKGFGVHAQLFGKVEQAAELWACADVIVARPSARIERRALVLRAPLVAVPDDDEELAVAEAFKERGIGRPVANLTTLAAEIDAQLAELDAARERLSRIPRGELPQVVRAIRRAIEDREALLRKRVTARSAPTLEVQGPVAATVGDEASAEPSSPLEAIGPDEGEAGSERREEELLAAEGEVNQRVTERQREVARWERRLELARERGDGALVREAEKQLDLQRSAMHAALAELARLDEQRRGRPARGSRRDARVAASFKRIEVESALEQLKRRLGSD